MKKAWLLSKLYLKFYGFGNIISDFKTDSKKALKTLALVVIIIMSLSGTVGMFVFMNAKMYDLLKPVNQQGLVITTSVILASMFIIVFGFASIIANYYVDKEGDIILSMPIKGWHILFGKFFSNYVYEIIVSVALMATGFVVYGIKSHAGVLFYIISVIVSVIIPLIPITLIYFIIIPLMKFGSIFRKKDATMILSSIVGILFAFGIQYVSRMSVNMEKDPNAMVQKLAGKDGLVQLASSFYYPSKWATYSITDYNNSHGIVNLFIFAIISIALVALLITAMSGIYSTSIVGSQEVSRGKKLSDSQLRDKLKEKNILSTLFDREVKLMNREPIYLLNGPFVILLMPLLFAFIIFIQKGDMGKDIDKLLKLENIKYYATIAAAGLAVFLGLSTNITSTSISREGKTYELIKGMPIDPRKYLLAKLLHGAFFGLIAAVMCSVIAQVIAGIGFINMLIAIAIAMLIMFPVQILGIILELAYPKLLWDSPQKAMKQNANGVIIILGAMVLVGALGFLVFNYIKTPSYGYTILTVVPLVISVILYQILMSYGNKRFYDIEL